jgi:ribosome-dependent ATPase
MTSADPVVRVTGVTHRYGKVAALAGVSLELSVGCYVALIGPDGVGKSTLIGLLAGARRIQSGSVHVLGGDMAMGRHRQAVCPRIAYMPQGLGRNLYPDLTVAENIAFFARLFTDCGTDHAQKLMQATGLEPFAGRLAGKLSGGMKQKLGLCCALIHGPELLLLDEPTTGVDPLSRRQFWDLIAGLRAQNSSLSVLVATAYMAEAERFERVVAMDSGRIVGDASPGALMARSHTTTLDAAFTTLVAPQSVSQTGTESTRMAQPSSGATAISARHLTCRFGDFTAVRDVSFDIRRGEIFGFLGSNGCGKTTTMRMLTGLLPPSTGEAFVFGQRVDGTDAHLRSRVGYMSQSFSLYSELTVRQNLVLHARLFHLPAAQVHTRVAEMMASFDLLGHADQRPDSLPLGIRQRLSLAVALVHSPELLILDEPTSGVDPLARDRFWARLVELSRSHGVTIFVSTHFMDEAARCDRIALMHAGRVLLTGAPDTLVSAAGARSLEDVFIACLEAAEAAPAPAMLRQVVRSHGWGLPAPARRLLAYARREVLELSRDRIRLGFSMLGTALLMLVFGFGINTDVDNTRFAVLDRDRTQESLDYLKELRGSPYFVEAPTPEDAAMLRQQLAGGHVQVGIEIPPGFGRDLRRSDAPEVGAWIDGAMPFRAETTRGYLEAAHQQYLDTLVLSQGKLPQAAAADVIERYSYNQDFKSTEAMVPGSISMLLALIPAVLMALAVVREKELGSIVNLYVTPATRLEFIIGKQLPYIGISMINFVLVATIAVTVFDVPLRGSLAALVAGTLIYVITTTGYGLLISAFARTQIAAMFGTAIMTVLPATQFSGMLTPVSTLTGLPWLMSSVFPMSYYLPICVGVFTKALGFMQLWPMFISLLVFVPVLLIASAFLLSKQGR